MSESERIRVTGRAITVRGNDFDTDRIIPARFLRCVTFDGLGEHAFEDDRAQVKERGGTHPFDDRRFADATILFVNENFGCGSSREHAPQAIMRWGKGIRALVGESFAEIFFGNGVALGIPCVTVSEADAAKIMEANETNPETEFTVDLENLTLTWDDQSLAIRLDDGPRRQFLEGKWDSTAELLAGKGQIAERAKGIPYFSDWK